MDKTPTKRILVSIRVPKSDYCYYIRKGKIEKCEHLFGIQKSATAFYGSPICLLLLNYEPDENFPKELCCGRYIKKPEKCLKLKKGDKI